MNGMGVFPIAMKHDQDPKNIWVINSYSVKARKYVLITHMLLKNYMTY